MDNIKNKSHVHNNKFYNYEREKNACWGIKCKKKVGRGDQLGIGSVHHCHKMIQRHFVREKIHIVLIIIVHRK